MGMVSEVRKWKRGNERTRVGFGRTEVSIPSFRSCFRDLQDGHGFMVIGVKANSAKWKRRIEKTRVEFAWREVSIPLF